MRINLTTWKLSLASMFAIAAIISTGCASTSKYTNWAMGRDATPGTENIAGTSSEAPVYGSELGVYAGTPSSSSTPTPTSAGLARSAYPAPSNIQPNYASGVPSTGYPSGTTPRYPTSRTASTAPIQQNLYTTSAPRPSYGTAPTGASTYGAYPTSPSSATQPSVNPHSRTAPAAYTAAAPTGSRTGTYPTNTPTAPSNYYSGGTTTPSTYSTGGSTYSAPSGTSGTYPSSPIRKSPLSTPAPSTSYPSTGFTTPSYPTTSTPSASSYNSPASYQSSSTGYRPGGTTNYAGGSNTVSVYNVGESNPTTSSVYNTGTAAPVISSSRYTQ
ncbi:MAG: hypothetical protein COA78_13950 [Blastopirellula sp.]|nr:MAG: hypothetical protein COA78_13950 [Blastopirellula sp.]